jgi:hypothetical protein
MASDRVECHSEYTYAERPVAIHWEGQRLLIAAIDSHWRTPDAKKFKVRVEDGRFFELSYRENLGEWHIHES